jgi:hypothetical protein
LPVRLLVGLETAVSGLRCPYRAHSFTLRE